ncbi:MAG: exonuclease SbcCD subunit D C-terminal domain-containing protein, partial [Erysipelotrichaceae bacterium]|nr:exonuclease SbcCD subunit D C-terminal domain-containing protein [Erysipelotrichaceae bacterium]
APLHPLREVKGELKDILIEESSNNKTNEYIRIVITDELVPQTARDSLFTLFEAKNSMICEIAHEVTRESSTINNICERSDTKTISELFNDFYRSRNGDEFPDEKDQELINMVEQQVMHVDDDEKVDVPNKNDIQKIIDFIMKQEEEA